MQAIKLSKPLKFLIVDDSRAIQAIIRRAVAQCGYEPIEVHTAINGEEALNDMESFVPDLVITDWHMPKVSGLEMVQAMRQMGYKNIRVGFVTTERSPDLLAEAVANGAMFILHKPFDDAELVAVVTAAVKDLVSVELPPMAPRSQQEPVPIEVLHRQLSKSLSNIPFRLIPNDAMTLENLSANAYLGLYGASGRKGVYAIAVMDANAVCMIGGGAARKNPTEVRAMMATGMPETPIVNQAENFLRSMEAGLSESAAQTGTNVTLAKASLVKNTLAKLAEIMVQKEGRSDYRVSIPGYGEGRVAFFVMPS